MKKAWISSFGVFSILFCCLAAGSTGGEKKAFSLKEDLVIGVNGGDENYPVTVARMRGRELADLENASA